MQGWAGRRTRQQHLLLNNVLLNHLRECLGLHKVADEIQVTLFRQATGHWHNYIHIDETIRLSKVAFFDYLGYQFEDLFVYDFAESANNLIDLSMLLV